jgi:hypothetical protein
MACSLLGFGVSVDLEAMRSTRPKPRLIVIDVTCIAVFCRFIWHAHTLKTPNATMLLLCMLLELFKIFHSSPALP